jgi:hypothetical protein
MNRRWSIKRCRPPPEMLRGIASWRFVALEELDGEFSPANGGNATVPRPFRRCDSCFPEGLSRMGRRSAMDDLHAP